MPDLSKIVLTVADGAAELAHASQLAKKALAAVAQLQRSIVAGECAEFWSHPDVLEGDVAADAWYPEAARG
jgi:hypothetical protein